MCKIKETNDAKMAKNLNLGNCLDDFEVEYLQIANFSEK